jgi:hypothetical protein
MSRIMKVNMDDLRGPKQQDLATHVTRDRVGDRPHGSKLVRSFVTEFELAATVDSELAVVLSIIHAGVVLRDMREIRSQR